MFCCHCLPCISPFHKNLRSQILLPSPYLPDILTVYLVTSISLQLCDSLTADDVSKGFKTTKQADKNAKKLESDMGTVHTLLNEEQAAFADWINDTFIGKDVIFISTFSEYY